MSKSDRNLANPIYAAVGAGDLALKQVNEVIAQLRERTETAKHLSARKAVTGGMAGERVSHGLVTGIVAWAPAPVVLQ